MRKCVLDIPLEIFLYYRFGFNWRGLLEENPVREIDSIVADESAWNKTRTLLAHTTSPVDERFKAQIIEFVQGFFKDGGPSPTAWDLHDSHANPLCESPSRHVISLRKFGADVYYFIEPLVCFTTQQWVLVTPSAAATVEAIRRENLLSASDVVRYFLERGIPFSTRIRGPPLPSSPSLAFHSHCGLGLGRRAPDFNPDVVEYGLYQRVRDALLREPRARAALMKGGIVWRLAVESLSYTHVLSGPSADVCSNGHVLSSPLHGNYWDDTLSENELDIICGVYKVYTGYGIQSADFSWWPKPSAWMKSGLSVGYWSPYCEDWFQRRLGSILDNTAKLRNAAQWTGSLKLIKQQRKLAQSNEEFAAKFLANQFGRTA